jgi:hypothetical protein
MFQDWPYKHRPASGGDVTHKSGVCNKQRAKGAQTNSQGQSATQASNHSVELSQ